MDNVKDIIECHQSVIDMYKELADYEMVASQIFAYIQMNSYKRYFDKMAIKHFGTLGDIVDYVIYKYGMIITPKCNCEFKELIKEYDGVKNSDLDDEDVKDIMFMLLKKEKEMIDKMMGYVKTKMESYKEKNNNYSILYNLYNELYYLCKQIKIEMSKLKEINYDLKIIKSNERNNLYKERIVSKYEKV